MAVSTCVKCGSSSFEMVEPKIKTAAYRLYFIQCASCGGVVGVQEFNNITATLEHLFKQLNLKFPYAAG